MSLLKRTEARMLGLLSLHAVACHLSVCRYALSCSLLSKSRNTLGGLEHVLSFLPKVMFSLSQETDRNVPIFIKITNQTRCS